jgi:hypothetical protein
MIRAATAAPRHPIGPASLAAWLLCPLEAPGAAAAAAAAGPHSVAAGGADAAALRTLGARLPGAPYLRPDVARCYWRLWRGKWARLAARLGLAAAGGGAVQQRQEQREGVTAPHVEEVLDILQVGLG